MPDAARPLGSDEVEAAVVGAVEQHPLADAGHPPRRPGRAVARPAPAGWLPHEWLRKNDDVVRRQVEALARHLDPALARAGQLVGGRSLSSRPSTRVTSTGSS